MGFFCLDTQPWLQSYLCCYVVTGDSTKNRLRQSVVSGARTAPSSHFTLSLPLFLTLEIIETTRIHWVWRWLCHCVTMCNYVTQGHPSIPCWGSSVSPAPLCLLLHCTQLCLHYCHYHWPPPGPVRLVERPRPPWRVDKSCEGGETSRPTTVLVFTQG